MVPISGSAYTYSYGTLGELVAWIIGWDLIIEYAIGNVAVAISWANYFNTLLDGLGIHLPRWLAVDFQHRAREDAGRRRRTRRTSSASRSSSTSSPSRSSRLITIVLVWGIRESAQLQLRDGRRSSSLVLGVLRHRQLQVREAGELDAVRAERDARASSPAPRSSSSPTSASTRSRRRPRRRAIRSATCRSASSARSIICTVIYVDRRRGLHGDDPVHRADGRRSRPSRPSRSRWR